MAQKSDGYRKFLLDELKRRERNNPAYSLRAFARDLNVSASRLSEVFNGKCGISKRRAVDFAKKLRLSPLDEAIFIDMVDLEHTRSHLSRKWAEERLRAKLLHAKTLQAEDLSILSEWYYLPIVELSQTADFVSTAEYIAKRLRITLEQATAAIDTLVQMNLLSWQEGRLIQVHPDRSTTANIPTPSLRQHNKRYLQLAGEAIDNRPLPERDFSTIIMAIDKSKMELAKERIRNFRRELMKELEALPSKDAVYCLSMGFFEVTEAAT